jgi:nitroreductase
MLLLMTMLLRRLLAFLCAVLLFFYLLSSMMSSPMWPGSNSPIVYPSLDADDFVVQDQQSQQGGASSLSFRETVERRVSARSFQTDTPVSDHDIYNALRMARLAPSAGNLQAYQVVVVRARQQKRKVAAAALHQEWIETAPVILVFLADMTRSSAKYHDRGRHLYSVQDATIAAAYTQLALTNLGLSSCWVGAFHEEEVLATVVHDAAAGDKEGSSSSSSSLSLQQRQLRPVVVMPVGYAATDGVHRRRKRRAIRDFVHYDYYNSQQKEELYHKKRSTANKK